MERSAGSLRWGGGCDIIYHKMNKFELLLREKLEDLRDEEYGDFVAKGVPGVPRENILGVRVPEIRGVVAYAIGEIFSGEKTWSFEEAGRLSLGDRALAMTGKTRQRNGKRQLTQWGFNEELYHGMNKFLEDLPHSFLEYDYAHAQIISRMNNFTEAVSELEKFLPYVNNWIICDTTNPGIFRKNLDEVLELSLGWLKSEKPFIARFGVNMMMRYFLGDFFSEDFLEEVAELGWRAEEPGQMRELKRMVKMSEGQAKRLKQASEDREWTETERYYVKMGVAWYFATALAKKWEATLSILTEEKLPIWIHNKAITKATESRRITPEQKDLLRGLKR